MVTMAQGVLSVAGVPARGDFGVFRDVRASGRWLAVASPGAPVRRQATAARARRTQPATGEPAPAARCTAAWLPSCGAVLIVLAGALWLVDRSSSPRLPGSDHHRWAQRRGRGAAGGRLPWLQATRQRRWLSTTTSCPATRTSRLLSAAEGWIYAQAGVRPQGESLLRKGRER